MNINNQNPQKEMAALAGEDIFVGVMGVRE